MVKNILKKLVTISIIISGIIGLNADATQIEGATNLPMVTVGLPSLVGSSVTANGNITTDGASVTRRGFKYGLTTRYGSDIHEDGSFGTGTFKLAINGLTPNTSYHFMAYATNRRGTSYSRDILFNPAQLMVVGNKLYRNGSEVKIKGVNYRGYLKDPYGNWHLSGEMSDSAVTSYRPAAVEANLTDLQNAGINCLETMVSISDWANGGSYITNYLDFIDRANNHGIIVIIKPTCIFPYWTTSASGSLSHNLPYGGWSDAEINKTSYPDEYTLMPNRAAFITWWSNLAKKVSGKTNLIIQMYSEPHQKYTEDYKVDSNTKTEYFAMAQQAIKAGRDVGAVMPIWVGYGTAGDVDLSAGHYDMYTISTWIANVNALADPLSNIVLDVHFYTESIRDVTKINASAHVPSLDSQGRITGILIDNSGSGYSYTPLIYIEPYGSTRPAQVSAVMTNGRLTGVNIIDPGLGYSHNYKPKVVIERAYPLGYVSYANNVTYGSRSGLAAAAANYCILIGEIGGDPNNPRDMKSMQYAMQYFQSLNVGMIAWCWESNAKFRYYWDYYGMLGSNNQISVMNNWGNAFCGSNANGYATILPFNN